MVNGNATRSRGSFRFISRAGTSCLFVRSNWQLRYVITSRLCAFFILWEKFRSRCLMFVKHGRRSACCQIRLLPPTSRMTSRTLDGTRKMSEYWIYLLMGKQPKERKTFQRYANLVRELLLFLVDILVLLVVDIGQDYASCPWIFNRVFKLICRGGSS